MNRNLTEKVKKFALELGADLVGIAPIERFAGAPLMMSPQGLMPTARNVIVCAIHHPDAAMELGGEKHPQKIGPYSIQYEMNCKLDYIAFRVAKLMDTLGYDVIPIASSNIWRYRDFMNLKANFAPDISHIYAATCAGLGQLGWQGLTMSPEYGPWNRFISIITNAPLCGTPMYEDIKLCDMCGECIKHCPTDAYRKEVNGVKSIEVEGKTFKFANKNLWRCAWGEHFELDLDLEIPDVVNEEVILDNINKYGSRGGEMGCCVKYCLPAHLRQDGGDFTTTYIRKKHVYASDLPVHRRLYDDLAGLAQRYSVDNIAFLDEETLNNAGIDYKNVFSPAKGAVVYSISLKKAEGELPESELLRSHGRGDGVLSAGINPEGAALSFFRGFANLEKHIQNMQRYGVPVVVAVNAFTQDTKEEIAVVQESCKNLGVICEIADVWGKGPEGGLDLAQAVIAATEQEMTYKPLYDPQKTTIEEKITAVVREIYGGDTVVFTPKARQQMKQFSRNGWEHLPVCMAKTQYSLSDNPKQLARPEGFSITIREFVPKIGAGFIVALTGDILTMPGLPKQPAALNMDVLEDGTVVGLF